MTEFQYSNFTTPEEDSPELQACRELIRRHLEPTLTALIRPAFVRKPQREIDIGASAYTTKNPNHSQIQQVAKEFADEIIENLKNYDPLKTSSLHLDIYWDGFLTNDKWGCFGWLKILTTDEAK